MGLTTQTSEREIGGIFVTEIPVCFPESWDEGKGNDCQNGSSPAFFVQLQKEAQMTQCYQARERRSCSTGVKILGIVNVALHWDDKGDEGDGILCRGHSFTMWHSRRSDRANLGTRLGLGCVRGD